MFKKSIKQFIKFGLVGASGLGVGLAVINIIMRCYENFVIANIVAFVIAATWNFVLNHKFTFKNNVERHIVILWAMFIGSSLIGAFSNWAISFSLYYNLEIFKQHYNLAAVCGVIAGYLINFLFAKHIVFKPDTINDDLIPGNRNTVPFLTNVEDSEI